MITYNKLYEKLYSYENLLFAYKKAKKGKPKKIYVVNFEKNLEKNLLNLQEDLIKKNYYPSNMNRFIVRDPKTRTIHSSIFRDRIVHHAIINILGPIYQHIFIYDSFASQKGKGSHLAVERFEYFINKVSNGKVIKNNISKNQIRGYCLKADFRKYFDSIDHKVLIKIFEKKIRDKDFIDLITKILSNFETYEGTGMPLGNYTSQFFANVYLNELDYYVKHILNVKYYIRYVDDFVILHKNRNVLEYYLKHIKYFLPCLKIKLHPEKTEIHALRNGVCFLGYRIFYNFKLLKKRNLRYFYYKINLAIKDYNSDILSKERFEGKINGWFGYAKFADTFNLRREIIDYINKNIASNKEKILIA
jgi:retron-type reverse transcriptase